MKIVSASPRDPRARALLQQSHALMASLFPAEENFALDVDGLCAPGIAFFAAEEHGAYLGCAALAPGADYGEVKSLFVADAARGRGVAEALMDRLEAEARDRHLPMLRLETGAALKAAMRLYTRRGFQPCGPFGDYTDNASSVFLEKEVSR